jgi:hypothetical protein
MVLVLSFVLQWSCSAAIDPAVRLAYSLEKRVQEHRSEGGPFQATCELDMPCGYVVVLHPDGELTTEQLITAGLSRSQVEAIRSLRLGPNAAIYVLPSDPAMPNSRTTHQRTFVRIPQVLVVHKSSSELLTVSFAGAPEARFIQSIQ